MMRPGEGSTVIGRSASLRGDIVCSEDLQIDGEVEGTVKVTGGRLTIGPEARVRASVTAAEVVVFGRVEGDIHTSGRVDLRSSAVVLGDVFAARLSIEENASLRGYVDPSRAGEPAAARPVAASTPASPSAPAAYVPPAAYTPPVAFTAPAAPRPATPVAAPASTRPGLATASGLLGARTPDLFSGQPSPAGHPVRQMPSALAAIAAAGRQEAGDHDERSDTAGKDDKGY